jgi:hypothetical protein
MIQLIILQQNAYKIDSEHCQERNHSCTPNNEQEIEPFHCYDTPARPLP